MLAAGTLSTVNVGKDSVQIRTAAGEVPKGVGEEMETRQNEKLDLQGTRISGDEET